MKATIITDNDMQNIYKKIGFNVKRIRKLKKVSQLKLALAIGHKAVGTVSMAELCINRKHLVKIADVLEVDLIDFFQEININPK